jgi:APA family basic amino acid/polyamine antiporter
MMIGFDLYLFYGMSNSPLNHGNYSIGNFKMVAGSGLGMTLALVVVAFIHHEGADDTGLFYFSLAFAALHAVGFLVSYMKQRQAN